MDYSFNDEVIVFLFSNTGLQPQGHVQTLLNMVEFGMDSQEAVDAPRYKPARDYTALVKYRTLAAR